MYRLLGDNHSLGGLPFAAQVFLRALDSVRFRLADDAGVTATGLDALARVAEFSGISSAALGNLLELEPKQLEALVDGLVVQQLVVPVVIGSNPEATTFVLTPGGHTLMAKTYERFQIAIDDAAGSLDPERRTSFESGMLKMARKLDAEAEKWNRAD
jgi:hypothetical protein